MKFVQNLAVIFNELSILRLMKMGLLSRMDLLRKPIERQNGKSVEDGS